MDKGVERRGVLSIARKELFREKKDKVTFFFLLSLTISSAFILILMFASNLLMTGYSTYLDGQAGYISEITLYRTVPTEYWGGVYGLGLRVPDFTEQLYLPLDSGDIDRQDLFFDCLESGATGGNEIYASNSSNISFGNLVRANNLALIDAYTVCNPNEIDPNLSSQHVDCAVNTFTSNTSFMVGSTNITNVSYTHSYKYDGNNTAFDIGVLNDTTKIGYGALVYAAHISSLQRGYSNSVLVNYQMILPSRSNSSTTYYFFTDPYDECPQGGLGENINSTLYGYVKDINNNTLSNVSVVAAGYSILTNSQGFYHLSFLGASGNHTVLGTKSGYDVYYTTISINFSSYIIPLNFTMNISTPGFNATLTPLVYGYVFDENNAALEGVSVYFGGSNTTSNSSGYYSFYPTVFVGQNPIIAIKTDYNNYYSIINITSSNTTINHNISMVSSSIDYSYSTGPYSTGPYSVNKESSAQASEQAKQAGQDYWINTKDITEEVRRNTFIEKPIGIYNFKGSTMTISISLSSSLNEIVKLEKNSLVIAPNSFGEFMVTLYGIKEPGVYNGSITVSGDITQEIPVSIKIVERNFPVETLLAEISLFDRVVSPGSELRYKLDLQNLLQDQGYKLFLDIKVKDENKANTFISLSDQAEIINSLTLLNRVGIPENLTEGNYVLDIGISYLNLFTSVTAPFIVSKPLYLYSVLGIPLWVFFVIISFISFVFLNLFLYKVYKDRKKRYRIELDYSTLPKPGKRVVRLGNIAETNRPSYFELERLTTHAIVAGATGMGKSISAQVIIEEALLNNVAVIVFDPTAQWSGMLRKCDDKKMLSFYPKFGLKPGDAKAFKGNVRQIKDARQVIDIKKHMNPGQIQIFSLNKLQPKDIDVFVANVIRGIFESGPEESPDLKLLLVLDEVHRLLSKFGGSGHGFLQVERACREFRKWGLGVILISQVLADFVGEIKANINTEVQTRTIEESDLERIKTKYGEEYLKSLVRAEVGVTMFQNAEYNRGKPYFINFRPILHNTRRLSDEELEKYNNYNDILDDLEYQIQQLEKEKPKKQELKLIAEDEIKKSIEEAKKSRQIFEKEEAKKVEKEKKEEKKENIDDKILQPLTFDNGIMVSSLKELKDYLPNMEREILARNLKKN